MTKELTQFKYEQLDESTADFLRQKESNMREIVGKAYTELGKELYEAQQELSKRGGKHEGVFGKWLQYIGMERRQATRLIQRYKLVIGTNCPEGEKLIEDLPVSLTYEIARPNTEDTPEHAQGKTEVLAGAIASLKEYRERIKEHEKKAEAERKERERLEKENSELTEQYEELANKEPETIVKTEYVEKETSEPYDRRLDEPYSVKRGRAFYEMMNEVVAIKKKYAQLKDGIEELSRLAYYDDDMKLKYRKADEFWRMLNGIFNENNDNIIDVEII